jgi:hypothetical protein
MERINRWRGVALVAAGLFAGSVFGPPLVQAATGLVTIQGADSSHKARVDGSGELMVNGQARLLHRHRPARPARMLPVPTRSRQPAWSC